MPKIEYTLGAYSEHVIELDDHGTRLSIDDEPNKRHQHPEHGSSGVGGEGREGTDEEEASASAIGCSMRGVCV